MVCGAGARQQLDHISCWDFALGTVPKLACGWASSSRDVLKSLTVGDAGAPRCCHRERETRCGRWEQSEADGKRDVEKQKNGTSERTDGKKFLSAKIWLPFQFPVSGYTSLPFFVFHEVREPSQ